jgi:hypothetical protein
MLFVLVQVWCTAHECQMHLKRRISLEWS